MTTNDRMGTRVLLSLALLAAVTVAVQVMFPQEAGAVVCSSVVAGMTDTDQDGIPDKCECDGITLANQQTISGSGTSTGSGFMNPNYKDLIVYLQPPDTGSSLLPAKEDLFRPVINDPNLTAPPGLGIMLHVYDTFPFQNTDRVVMSNPQSCANSQTITQRGAWITEDNISPDAASGSALGSTTCIGSPNCSNNSSTVYTLRVKNFVDTTCMGYTNCIDSGDRYGLKPSVGRNDMQGLYNLYNRQNINHELAHQMALVPAPAATKGNKGTSPTVTNNHYPTPTSGAGSIMVYSVYYKQDNSTPSTVTWYIPDTFITYDVTNKRLK